MTVHALILTGFGINCDAETACAFERAGAEARCVHLNDLIAEPAILENHDVLAIPGGFSFGDHVGSGRILANRLRYTLGEPLHQFIAEGKLAIGVCNGFQVMVKMGMLPYFDNSFQQEVTLTHNDSSRYEDRWTTLKPEPGSRCVWTQGLTSFEVPVRHGEGKFIPRDQEVLERLERNGQIALRYARTDGALAGGEFPHNPNGSRADIAGICDPSGRVFGLMPHPEAFQHRTNHPRWTREDLPEEGAGLQLFPECRELRRRPPRARARAGPLNMEGASAEPVEEMAAPAPLPPYIYIDTEEAWRECLLSLRGEKRIAVDLEANSLFAYREQISLIQLSTETQDYIIDPLAGLDLTPFVKLLADCSIEKIFHASEYDLVLLKRDFKCEVCNLFDTMWAARILGFTNMGLAGFLKDFYNVTLSKKYQKANWAARPLTRPQLEYAQKDTHYLLRLRDLFAARLEEAGYSEEAREIFKNKCRVILPDRKFNPDAFWSLRGARELDPAGRSLLRALYVYRDSEAARRNVPPFKVLSNETLLHIAKTAPVTLQDLKEKSKLPERIIDRMGSSIVRVLEEARSGPTPTRPQRPQRRTNEEHERYERLQQWRKEMAQERGVESDVILTRETMWELARRNPVSLSELEEITTLGPTRIAMYGPLILEQLR